MPTAPDNLVIRGKTTKVDDSKEYQRIQGTGREGENFGAKDHYIYRAQNYGMTAHPPTGSVGLVSPLNGNPNASMSNFLEHPKYRPKNLAEKDMMLYSAHNMQEGGEHKDFIKLEADKMRQEHAKHIIIKAPRIDLNPS